MLEIHRMSKGICINYKPLPQTHLSGEPVPSSLVLMIFRTVVGELLVSVGKNA